MFTTRWRLFRVCGIPIYVDASWLIIVALLAWTLTAEFRQAVPSLTAPAYWILGLATALSFFVCIVLHELGHALVAQRMGMPIRGITLFMFGGVAELGGQPSSAGKEFLMAIAGPVVSAVLALLFWGLSAAGGQADWAPSAVVFFGQLAFINVAVLMFNLVPAFPLDGGRVLRSALWGAMGSLRKATYWASLLGQGFAWLLIGLGVLSMIQGFFINGMWLGLIGLFLSSAARASYQQVLIRQALEGEPVRRFMNTEPVVVPPSLDLRQWVEDYVYRYHHKTFPVAANGHLEGVISTRDLDRFPRQEWEHHSVAEVMRPDVEAVSLRPSADALQALTQMQRTDASRLLVTDNGRLVGILSMKDLLRFLQLKLELEGDMEGGNVTPVSRPVAGSREELVHR
jgi:Zn-dependent protease/CBS domain-containing protein